MTLFELILITHFIGDWILQPTKMGMAKSTNAGIRAIHCLIYTACFFWIAPNTIYWMSYIFITHFVIDSYKPLYWFRKLRGDFKTFDEFKESFSTPSGFMINVVLDQIFHILTLLPLLYRPF